MGLSQKVWWIPQPWLSFPGEIMLSGPSPGLVAASRGWEPGLLASGLLPLLGCFSLVLRVWRAGPREGQRPPGQKHVGRP